MPTLFSALKSKTVPQIGQSLYQRQYQARIWRNIRRIAAADPYIRHLAASLPWEMLKAPRWGLSNGKMPCDSGGWPVDATDPKQGRSFWHAAWLLVRHKHQWSDEGRLHFIVADGDGFTAIDLDKCRCQTDGIVYADKKRLIDRFDTYTEISSSGAGLHIFMRGQKPGTATKTKGIEIFDGRDRAGEPKAKPIVITGEILPGKPAEISDCQHELTSLYQEIFPPAPQPTCNDHEQPGPSVAACGPLPSDQTIIQKISRSKQSEKFLRLWAGDIFHDYHGDQSAADAGLCGILAGWCAGDVVTIDRIFRDSGLYRAKDAEHLAKWDRDEYRITTIEGAVAKCGWRYDWSRHSQQRVCGKGLTAGAYRYREEKDQQITESGTRADEMLTRTISKPNVDYRFTACRRIKVRQTSRKDNCQRRALTVACMHRECDQCRVPWINDRLDWFDDIICQWQEVHITTAACDVESNAIKQQIKRRAAKEKKLGNAGIDVAHINIPIEGGQVIWLTNVPTTKSTPATQEKWRQALSFAIGSIRKRAHIGCTGGTFKGKGPERQKLTEGLKFQPRKKKKTDEWVTDKGQRPLSKASIDRIVSVLTARGYKPSVKDDFEFNQTSIRYSVPPGFTDEDAKRLDEEIIDGSPMAITTRQYRQPANDRRVFVLLR